MFLEGHPRAWCRRCGFFKWADQLSDREPPSKAELEIWREAQIEREEARKRSAQLALKNLRDSQLWEDYYAQLDVQGRAYWTGRGIPPAWQDFWQLGWNPQSRWGPPTATIPLFNDKWDLLNIKHRLVGNDTPGGKYRYELHGLDPPIFRAEPAEPLEGHIYVIEGEIKAAVVKVTLNDRSLVVGLPSASPSENIVNEFKGATHITLVMDPGAELEAERLVGLLSANRCVILIPPLKIDDGILAGKLTATELRLLLAGAI